MCDDNKKYIKKYILRISLIYIIWSAIYLLWQIPYWYMTNCLSLGAFKGYFLSFFIKGSYYHTWYLLTTVYAIFLISLLLRLFSKKLVVCIAIILYLFGTIITIYYIFGGDLLLSVKNAFDKLGCFSNALFKGIPFITLGFIIDDIKLKRKYQTICLFASIIMYGLEILLLKRISQTLTSKAVLFMLPLVFFFFMFVKNTNAFSTIKKEKSKFIRNLSIIIYCVHPMFINICTLFIHKTNNANADNIMLFVCVSCMSLLFGIIVVLLSKKHKFLKYLY